VTSYVALVRAVNVGGRKLLMEDLRRIAGDLGFAQPRTFIASGNLLFESGLAEKTVKRTLEEALSEHTGATVEVMVRTAAEMAAAGKANPFPDAPANRVAAIFLDHPPSANSIEGAKNRTDEEIALGTREIYVHYPSGMGTSKLRIPAANHGTARNMNSVKRLAELAKEQA
jgi:uncharacterized protein (DUF1697 family)